MRELKSWLITLTIACAWGLSAGESSAAVSQPKSISTIRSLTEVVLADGSVLQADQGSQISIQPVDGPASTIDLSHLKVRKLVAIIPHGPGASDFYLAHQMGKRLADGLVFHHVKDKYFRTVLKLDTDLVQPDVHLSPQGTFFISSRNGYLHAFHGGELESLELAPDLGAERTADTTATDDKKRSKARLFRTVRFLDGPAGETACYSIFDKRYHKRALTDIAWNDSGAWSRTSLKLPHSGPCCFVAPYQLQMVTRDKWIQVDLKVGQVETTEISPAGRSDQRLVPIELFWLPSKFTLVATWRRPFQSVRYYDVRPLDDGTYHEVFELSTARGGKSLEWSERKITLNRMLYFDQQAGLDQEGGLWLSAAEGGLAYRSPNGFWTKLDFHDGIDMATITRLQCDRDDIVLHHGSRRQRLNKESLLSGGYRNEANRHWRHMHVGLHHQSFSQSERQRSSRPIATRNGPFLVYQGGKEREIGSLGERADLELLKRFPFPDGGIADESGGLWFYGHSARQPLLHIDSGGWRWLPGNVRAGSVPTAGLEALARSILEKRQQPDSVNHQREVAVCMRFQHHSAAVQLLVEGQTAVWRSGRQLTVCRDGMKKEFALRDWATEIVLHQQSIGLCDAKRTAWFSVEELLRATKRVLDADDGLSIPVREPRLTSSLAVLKPELRQSVLDGQRLAIESEPPALLVMDEDQVTRLSGESLPCSDPIRDVRIDPSGNLIVAFVKGSQLQFFVRVNPETKLPPLLAESLLAEQLVLNMPEQEVQLHWEHGNSAPGDSANLINGVMTQFLVDGIVIADWQPGLPRFKLPTLIGTEHHELQVRFYHPQRLVPEKSRVIPIDVRCNLADEFLQTVKGLASDRFVERTRAGKQLDDLHAVTRVGLRSLLGDQMRNHASDLVDPEVVERLSKRGLLPRATIQPANNPMRQ